MVSGYYGHELHNTADIVLIMEEDPQIHRRAKTVWNPEERPLLCFSCFPYTSLGTSKYNLVDHRQAQGQEKKSAKDFDARVPRAFQAKF